MPSYTAPTKDIQFVLHDVLNVTQATSPATTNWRPISPPPFSKKRAN